MPVYNVSGNIKHFDQIIAKIQNENTTAVSKKKAINNILYRFKKDHGYTSNAPIKLVDIRIEEI